MHTPDDPHRISSLRNLIEDPRCALQGKPPKCVLRIRVDTVYFQCARAILRSGLWQAATAPAGVPTVGRIIAAISGGDFDGEAYDQTLPARQRSTLY
ncbi:hypothetical protein [Uliginosibacterium sediminicola]|uniref:Pyridoxamine 5'-phosphate oxidase putative domain-containing protein n=1 Tax=Uliginosibacterium sediminicola TaxID=2024550 RepID=A0ABU9YYH4_9RHOO